MSTHQTNDQQSTETSDFWQPKVVKAFDALCLDQGFNPVRLRRLIDQYILTNQKPSRQQLVDSLKHKPRIQVRAAVLGSVTKKLYAFTGKYIPTAEATPKTK